MDFSIIDKITESLKKMDEKGLLRDDAYKFWKQEE